MAAVLGRVTEWVSDDFPGWARVELQDADGRLVTVVDKAPVLTDERLDAGTPLPKDVWLACKAEPERDGRVLVTLLHVEASDGLRQFAVPPDRVR